MATQTLMQGLGMLQRAREGKAAREFDLQRMFEAAKLEEGAAARQREFQSIEAAKARGPVYKQLQMQEEEIKRKQEGFRKARERMAGTPGGELPSTQAAFDLGEAGAISGERVTELWPDASQEKMLAEATSLALSGKIPFEVADNINLTYRFLGDLRAQREAIKNMGNKDNTMPYSYDPGPVMESVQKRIEETYKGYDFEDPMDIYEKKRSEKDPVFKANRESIKWGLLEKIAEDIARTDATFRNDSLGAMQAASLIMENIGLGGVKSLVDPKFYEESGGNYEGIDMKGWNKLGMRVNKGNFFGRGLTGTPTPPWAKLQEEETAKEAPPPPKNIADLKDKVLKEALVKETAKPAPAPVAEAAKTIAAESPSKIKKLFNQIKEDNENLPEFDFVMKQYDKLPKTGFLLNDFFAAVKAAKEAKSKKKNKIANSKFKPASSSSEAEKTPLQQMREWREDVLRGVRQGKLKFPGIEGLMTEPVAPGEELPSLVKRPKSFNI